MPELPEAETIARDLRVHLPGHTIRRVEVLRDDVLAGEAGAFREGLRGRRVEGVERRGKNLVVRLDADGVLLVNLGMTGRLLHRPDGRAPEPDHVAVALGLSGGAWLLYDDVRRFGRLEVLGEAGWRERDATLGPEPMDPALTADGLHAGLAGSRTPVRSWLLDQRRIAGIGNIYANEALWRARIDPRTPAASLPAAAAVRLLEALRGVLAEAIERRGTTIRDYRDADGRSGGFAERLAVYGREGEPCPRCGGPVRRIVFGGRAAFVCPECQNEP